MLVAIGARTTTCASSFVTGYWAAVRILLAPKLYLIFFSTLDASLAHLLVVFDFCLRKLSVFPEDNIETQTEDAQSDEYKCCKKYFHLFLN